MYVLHGRLPLKFGVSPATAAIQAKEKFKAVEQAIRDHLAVLEWERGEARRVRAKVAEMQERQLQVVEQRLKVEEQQLEQENNDAVPEDLRRLM